MAVQRFSGCFPKRFKKKKLKRREGNLILEKQLKKDCPKLSTKEIFGHRGSIQ